MVNDKGTHVKQPDGTVTPSAPWGALEGGIVKTIGPLIFIALVAFAIYKAVQSSKDETKEARTIAGLPPSVQHTVASMDTLSQNAFFSEYEKLKRKTSVSYILWFIVGCHYLYNKKVGMQFLYWFTFAGAGIWALVDLFRMPSIVRETNDGIARSALTTLSIGHQFRSAPATAPTSFPIVSPELGGAAAD